MIQCKSTISYSEGVGHQHTFMLNLLLLSLQISHEMITLERINVSKGIPNTAMKTRFVDYNPIKSP